MSEFRPKQDPGTAQDIQLKTGEMKSRRNILLFDDSKVTIELVFYFILKFIIHYISKLDSLGKAISRI